MNDAVVIWALIVCGLLLAATVAGLIVVVIRQSDQIREGGRRGQDLFMELAGQELKVRGFDVQEKAIQAAIRIGTPAEAKPADAPPVPMLRPTLPRDEEAGTPGPTL